jgi:hypothetical protein
MKGITPIFHRQTTSFQRKKIISPIFIISLKLDVQFLAEWIKGITPGTRN